MFNQQKGVTLIELLTSVAIGSILLLIIGTVMYQMNLNFIASMEKVKIEEDFAMAELHLRAAFSQAINVTTTTTPISNFNNNLGQALANYSLTGWTPSTGSGNIDTLAVFLKEQLPSGHTSALATQLNTTGIDQRYLASALFFQRPTLDRYGVLYIHSNSSRTTNLAPSYRDTRIERLVDLQIIGATSSPFQSFLNNGDTQDGLVGQNMLTSYTIQLTQRYYFNKSAHLQPERWCPPSQSSVSVCQTDAPYNDLTRIFHFNLRNNVLGFSISQKEGGTPLYRRLFDHLYFLKINLPVGSLSR